MEIREGLNTEYAREKFDVCLDDGDLEIALAEHHVPPGTFLSVTQKYMLLQNEARIIVLYEAVRLGIMTPEQQQTELGQRVKQREEWMEGLRVPARTEAAAEPAEQ